jgi:small-conductance mechanosensitive channel
VDENPGSHVSPLENVERRILTQLQQMEQRLNQKLEKIMASQADIDALTAQIVTSLGDLQTQSTAIGADVTAIQAALAALPPSLDITALQAAVASLATNQASLDASVGTLNDVVPPAPAS